MSPDAEQVFIVDDEQIARESIAAVVESMGLSTSTFASAEEVLGRVRPDDFGCLISDMRMPGFSGLELIERLRVAQVTLPVILITAYADVPLAVRAMQAGAVTVLEKPYRDHELWAAIRCALDLDRERREENERLQLFRRQLVTLTVEERDVMNLIVEGHPNKVIALRLGVSLRTVESRRHMVFEKLGVDSVAALVRLVVLINPQE